MHLQSVGAILKCEFHGTCLAGEFAGLAYGDKACAEFQGHCPGNDKSPGLNTQNQVYSLPRELVRKTIHNRLKTLVTSE
ncbi:MAG: hypothetical protein AMS15_02245 [Planctomycetes bacterium DG_23]|nr:MAG: hypothetical protein AMS15_02245 [Planctomycetes bacterium DG_23]